MAVVKIATSTHRSEEFDAGDLVTKMSIVKRQKVKTDSTAYTNGDSRFLDEALVLEGHEKFVLTNRFSIDGSMIASGGSDKLLHLWNTPSTEVLQNDSIPVNFANLSGHKSAITSLEWLSDSHSLVTSSADRTLGLWDITTGERVRKFTGHSLVVNDVRTFQGDGIVSVSDDQRACVWDARTKQAAKEIKIEYPLLAVCVGKREPNIVFFSGIDPTIYGYDLRDTSKPLIQIDTLHSDAITSLCLSNDDFTLISNSMDGTIRAYDSRPFESNQRIKPVIFDDAPAGEEHLLIRSKQFVRDGVPYVISGSCNKSSVILNMKTERLAHNFYGHEGTVIDVDVHPNEKVLVSGSTDGNLIVREF